VAGTTGQAG